MINKEIAEMQSWEWKPTELGRHLNAIEFVAVGEIGSSKTNYAW